MACGGELSGFATEPFGDHRRLLRQTFRWCSRRRHLRSLAAESQCQALQEQPRPPYHRTSNGKQVGEPSDMGSHGLASILRDRRGMRPSHRTGIFRRPHEGGEVRRNVRRATSSSSFFCCRISSSPIFDVSRAAPRQSGMKIPELTVQN